MDDAVEEKRVVFSVEYKVWRLIEAAFLRKEAFGLDYFCVLLVGHFQKPVSDCGD